MIYQQKTLKTKTFLIISVESSNFKQGVQEKLFVMERNSTLEKFIPALTWFRDVPVAALLDITNQNTVAWLKMKLSELQVTNQSHSVSEEEK